MLALLLPELPVTGMMEKRRIRKRRRRRRRQFCLATLCPFSPSGLNKLKLRSFFLEHYICEIMPWQSGNYQLSVMQPLKPGKYYIYAMTGSNDIQDVRYYIVSYRKNNIFRLSVCVGLLENTWYDCFLNPLALMSSLNEQTTERKWVWMPVSLPLCSQWRVILVLRFIIGAAPGLLKPYSVGDGCLCVMSERVTFCLCVCHM